MFRSKGQILLLVICYKAHYSSHGSGIEFQKFHNYSKVVLRTGVISMSRMMINGHISSKVKLESVKILHKPPV